MLLIIQLDDGLKCLYEDFQRIFDLFINLIISLTEIDNSVISFFKTGFDFANSAVQ